MSKKRLIIRYISLAFVIIICVLIFIMSNQTGIESSKVSDKTIDIISETTHVDKKDDLDFGLMVRKSAHIIEYFVLALFTSIFVLSFNINKFIAVAISFIFSIFYSISDEFHQSFISGRVGSATDVLIDSIGIVLACTLCLLFYSILSKKIQKT